MALGRGGACCSTIIACKSGQSNHNVLKKCSCWILENFISQMHYQMNMKAIWPLVFLIFFAAGICTAQVPDMRGEWIGSFSSYNEGGANSNWMNGSLVLTVLEQKDRIFAGNLTVKPENMTEINEGIAGAIGLDNRTFYLAESGKGYALGTIVSNDELEYVYIVDGRNASASIDKLYRKKM